MNSITHLVIAPLKRPPPKARTQRHAWNKTPQKPKALRSSASSGPSKDKKKSRHTAMTLGSPKPVGPSMAKENRTRQGVRSRVHSHRRDTVQSQMSVVREIIKELQDEAPALRYSPTPSHHSSASDYSLASPRRGPNNAVDIVEGTDGRNFKHRHYRTLRQEAEEEVHRSRHVWEDTPFSAYALNCTVFSRRYLTLPDFPQHSIHPETRKESLSSSTIRRRITSTCRENTAGRIAAHDSPHVKAVLRHAKAVLRKLQVSTAHSNEAQLAKIIESLPLQLKVHQPGHRYHLLVPTLRNRQSSRSQRQVRSRIYEASQIVPRTSSVYHVMLRVHQSNLR